VRAAGVIIEAPCSPLTNDWQQCRYPRRINKTTVCGRCAPPQLRTQQASQVQLGPADGVQRPLTVAGAPKKNIGSYYYDDFEFEARVALRMCG
jgi:hypothetical protein